MRTVLLLLAVWQLPLLSTCQQIVGGCQIPGAPPNGRIQWSYDGSTVSVSYSCNQPYRLQPSQTPITCRGGVWSHRFPECVGSVIPPRISPTLRPFLPQAGTYTLTLSLQGGDRTALYDILVYTFRNGQLTLLRDKSRYGVRYTSFPITLDGLSAGSYSIRIDQQLAGGGRQTVSTLSTQTGRSNIQLPFIPAWPSTGVTTASLRQGQVTIELPNPPSGQAYQFWTVQWRRGSSGAWQTRRVSTRERTATLSTSGPGAYQVRLQLQGSGGTTPYSIPLSFTASSGFPTTSPCSPNPCENNGFCTSTIGGNFNCICASGYTGPRCSQPSLPSFNIQVSFITNEPNPNARYNLVIYSYNEALGTWQFREGSSSYGQPYSAFPVTVPNLQAGLTGIRIDRVRDSGNETLTTLHQRIGGGLSQGVKVPEWQQGRVTTYDPRTVTVRVVLPPLTGNERVTYSSWRVCYRLTREPVTQEKCVIVPTSQIAALLRNLPPGAYLVRVLLVDRFGRRSGGSMDVGFVVEAPTTTAPLNGCARNPCLNRATCYPIGSNFYCACPIGFSGRTCEIGARPTTPPRTQAPDPCSRVVCQNGGTCRSRLATDSFTCDCAPGYTGQLCSALSEPTNQCASSPCLNGGTCYDISNRYYCSCLNRFRGDRCERDTQPARPCSSNPCSNGGTCQASFDGSRYTCRCPPGYAGPRCTQSTNVDECASSPCQNGGTCYDLNNRFFCACRSPYTGERCQQGPDPCSGVTCQNGGSCRSLPASNSFVCDCTAAYTGRFCADPVNVDECASSPCQNGGTCYDLSNRFFCACRSPYTGDRCEQEPDPCSGVTCQNGGTCRSLPASNSFVCDCTAAYMGRFCADREPCFNNPCENGGQCTARGSSFDCACLPGFTGATCANTVLGVTVNPTLIDINADSFQYVTCQTSQPLPSGSIANYMRWTTANGQAIAGNPRLIATGDQLIVFNPTEADVGIYKCVVTLNGVVSEAEFALSSGSTPVTTRPPIPAPTTAPPAPPTNPTPTESTIPIGFFTVTIQPSSAVRRPTNDTVLFCRVEALPFGYTVAGRTWSRTDGRPLPASRSNTFSNGAIIRISNHEISDSGSYMCTVEARNADGVSTSSSAVARIQVTTISVRLSPSNVALSQGGNQLLECIVTNPRGGSIGGTISWRRENSTTLDQHKGRYLQMNAVTSADTDIYCCSVDAGNGEMIEDCTIVTVGDICIAPDGKTMSLEEYRYINGSQTVREARLNPAADIIFLVDESRSMLQEHAWLEDISLGLDRTLQSEGIGSGILPNLFCMVGFAHPPDINGRVIRMESGQVMGDASEFNEIRKDIAQDGRTEDMYSAMQVGFDNCELRPGMACQVIGITDEGRSPLVDEQFADMKQKLEERGCILNVGVNEQMMSYHKDPPEPALGISSNNDSAIERIGGTYELVRGKGYPLAPTGHGTTHKDYVMLAFSNGGAAWDLNELRKGGNTADAFTKAFIDLKVREISRQTCQLCHCTSSPAPFCTPGCLGEPPFVDATGPKNVTYGSDVSILCVPIGGIPVPELDFQGSENSALPPRSEIRDGLDSSVLQVTNAQKSFCVDCTGTNLEGEHTDTHCVDVLAEPPQIMLTGSNRGEPVVNGDTVSLTCVPVAGIPDPTVSFTSVLPVNARTQTIGNSVQVIVDRATADFCINCTGQNALDSTTKQICVDVITPPDVNIAGGDEPAPKGSAVTLICLPVAGEPDPVVNWAGTLPPGAQVGDTGDGAVTLTIPSVEQNFCVDCVGTNQAGDITKTKCVDVLAEPPVVDVTRVGTAEGDTVPKGGDIVLRCHPISGVPEPVLRWERLPANAQVGASSDAILVTVSNIQDDFCVDCVGRSAAGTGRDSECVTIHEPPRVQVSGSNNGEPVVSGTEVTFTCIPLNGIPDPRLSYPNAPSGSLARPDGSRLLLTVASATSDYCVNCTGQNTAGSHSDAVCIDIISPPDIIIGGGENPVPQGDPVSLVCLPISGEPGPTVRWTGALPPGAQVTNDPATGTTITVPSVNQDFCVDCIGTNQAGQITKTKCVTVRGIPPRVNITGSNKGLPINQGADVDLICEPLVGFPDPTLSWDPSSLPADAINMAVSGNSIGITLRNVQDRVCIDCLGTNPAGNHRDTECITVLKQCPHPNNGLPLLSGQSVRNFTTRNAPPQFDFPASAVVAFVVDESGSMVGEHRWLAQGGNIAQTLENNLKSRGVGTRNPNQYGLVGFGHPDQNDPDRYNGAVLQDCTTAPEVQASFGGLYQDGRLEDGYSAISVAVNQLSCIRNINSRRAAGEKVACQVILVTDEGRDRQTSWEYESILNELRRRECVLNVVVWQRFEGRRSATRPWEGALGWASSGKAVLPEPGDSYTVVDDGRPVAITGTENTHEKYVKLAAATGGAAWDLEKLRTQRYRQSFTNGFIDVKVQEIIIQIIGMCYNCLCTDGRLDCTLLENVPGTSTCLSPLVTSSIQASVTPQRAVAEPGDLVELVCRAAGASAGTPVTVNWLPLSPRTRLSGGNLIILNATSGVDDQYYQCQANNAAGTSVGVNVELTVGPRRPGVTPLTIRRPAFTVAPVFPRQTTQPPRPRVLPGLRVSSNVRRVVSGSSFTLSCCYDGQYYSSAVWLKNGPGGGYIDLPSDVRQANGQLVFERASPLHQGRYECLAVLENAPVFANAQVTFNGALGTVDAALNQC